MAQLSCQLCQNSQATNSLLKCCQLFICSSCKERVQKAGQCPSCQKTLVPKKWHEPDPKLFQLVSDFYRNKPFECGRCDSTDRIQYCQDCEQNFCYNCIQDIHSMGLYQSHQITPLTDTRKILQVKKSSSKEQMCPDHKQKKEYICQCNSSVLCCVCLKSHRQSCNKKFRPFAEYKKEYFALMLQKLDHISKYKEYLSKSEVEYKNHFQKQKSVYQQCMEYVKNTFDNYAKLIEFKKNEITLQLQRYWEECEQIYLRNEANVKLALSQFDDFAMLIERFSQKAIGLEYLEKRMNVKNIEFECFIFKINGLEAVERELVQVSATGKKWVNPIQTLELRQRQQKTSLSSIGQSSVATTPAMLTQIHENHLLPRPLKLVSSTHQIQYSFIHLPYQKLKYEIQFGVGIKTKGQQVFKRVQANQNGKGTIEGLHPATSYRVRMRVENGNWGDVYEIATLQPQSFAVQNSNFARSDTKGTIMLLRSGTLYANNGYQFGVHAWELKILVDKTAHHESDTACISIGISNREYKKAVFVGSTINYGFQRENLRLKVVVDCDSNRMTIIDQNKQSQQVYQNIPDLPVYPTIINKGNSMVQLMVTF